MQIHMSVYSLELFYLSSVEHIVFKFIVMQFVFKLLLFFYIIIIINVDSSKIKSMLNDA